MPSAEPRPIAVPLVLIVDHDDDTRSMYAEYLRHGGRCAVDEAADGRDALAKAIALRPAVVVTETRIPGIDGLELCAILKRDVLTRAIPILVVTTDDHPESVARAHTVGAHAVVIKPCMPDALLAEILRVITASHERSGGDDVAGTSPLAAPPELVCPQCDRPLVYQRSHVGGVKARRTEQWDYYTCLAGCGTFQYRQRTRRLKKA